MSLSTKTTISVLIKSKKFISVLTPRRKNKESYILIMLIMYLITDIKIHAIGRNMYNRGLYLLEIMFFSLFVLSMLLFFTTLMCKI